MPVLSAMIRARWVRGLLPAFALATVFGCYAHARRDAPTPAPEAASGVMVSVPSGTFTMGDNQGEPDEYPERTVQVGGFRLDQTEVSNASYALCVQAKACDPSPYAQDDELGLPNHPVVGVTWDDASRFCAWVGKRLPTEAEWEYAAKGTELRKYPWAGAFSPDLANTALKDAYPQTAPVDAHREGASTFGLYNLAGNAAEWVQDYFDPTHYRRMRDVSDPSGPTSGRERVVRGGSYRSSAHTVRTTARHAKLPTESDNTIGFRCAAD